MMFFFSVLQPVKDSGRRVMMMRSVPVSMRRTNIMIIPGT